MKITVDIECTPKEARDFFGLPNVEPIQQALMGELQQRMSTQMGHLDPTALMKAWLPMGNPGLEQMQEMFWSNVARAAGKTPTPDKK